MSAEVHMGNTRRKIRALLAKAAPNSGCTPAERTTALKMANDVAAKYIPNKDDVIYAEIAKVSAPEPAPTAEATVKAAEAKAKAKKAAGPKKVKRGERIIELMSRKEGVSIAELQAEFGTAPHTCRAQISVEARKAGFKPTLKDGRYYRTAPKT